MTDSDAFDTSPACQAELHDILRRHTRCTRERRAEVVRALFAGADVRMGERPFSLGLGPHEIGEAAVVLFFRAIAEAICWGEAYAFRADVLHRRGISIGRCAWMNARFTFVAHAGVRDPVWRLAIRDRHGREWDDAGHELGRAEEWDDASPELRAAPERGAAVAELGPLAYTRFCALLDVLQWWLWAPSGVYTWSGNTFISRIALRMAFKMFGEAYQRIPFNTGIRTSCVKRWDEMGLFRDIAAATGGAQNGFQLTAHPRTYSWRVEGRVLTAFVGRPSWNGGEHPRTWMIEVRDPAVDGADSDAGTASPYDPDG